MGTGLPLAAVEVLQQLLPSDSPARDSDNSTDVVPAAGPESHRGWDFLPGVPDPSIPMIPSSAVNCVNQNAAASPSSIPLVTPIQSESHTNQFTGVVSDYNSTPPPPTPTNELYSLSRVGPTSARAVRRWEKQPAHFGTGPWADLFEAGIAGSSWEDDSTSSESDPWVGDSIDGQSAGDEEVGRGDVGLVDRVRGVPHTELEEIGLSTDRFQPTTSTMGGKTTPEMDRGGRKSTTQVHGDVAKVSDITESVCNLKSASTRIAAAIAEALKSRRLEPRESIQRVREGNTEYLLTREQPTCVGGRDGPDG